MKKPHYILLFATIVFCVFIAGVFVGRNHTASSISVGNTQNNVIQSAAQATGSEAPPPSATGKININSASKSQLMMLPGIGETLAQRIMDYRQDHGAFSCIEDLLYVEGIGQVKLENIEEYITVGE